jgi:hypothetical protein
LEIFRPAFDIEKLKTHVGNVFWDQFNA